METHPGEGVRKEEKFPNNRKPSHRQVCGELWNLRGQHNQEKKRKIKTTGYAPNHNCQQRSSSDDHDCHQRVEAGQGGADCITGAEDKDQA